MRITMFVILSLVLIVSVANAGQWQGSEVDRDGVVHVVNPSDALEPPVTVATAMAWRLGGGDDEDVVFGSIDDVAVGSDGNTYLLDSQVSTVYVVSPEGQLLRSIGRDGEGPAEFRMAGRVALLEDGNVCVLQVMPARAVMMTPAGDAVGDHPLPRGKDGSHSFLNGGSVTGGKLVLNLGGFVQNETSIGLETRFVRVDANGEVEATYWTLLQEQDLAKVTFDEKADAPPVWAAGPDGRFYINNSYDDYTISVFNASGHPVHIIKCEYEPLPKDARDLARTDSLMEADVLPRGMEISPSHRAVIDVLPRENGELWVLTSRGSIASPAGAVAQFDVFNGLGRFVRQLTIQGGRVPGRDGFFVVGDRVFVVTNVGDFASDFSGDETGGEISITCLRIGNGARSD